MKNKNPLYVVKGKTVLEAQGVFDMLVKKLNLEPVLKLIMSLARMLLEQVNNYPTFAFVKNLIDELMGKVTGLLGKFRPA